MAEYIRNYGGYTLTPDQLSQLKTILDAQQAAITANPSGSGLGIPIYKALLSYISTTEEIILPEGPPVEVTVPKLGVDQAVWNFINGAIAANSNVGFVAAFATNYTADQYTERGGQGDGITLAREASNQIALNLANDVIDHKGSVPGIEGIGVADGSAGAQKVFDTLPFYPNGDYAGWVGTLLFPYIGESNFYNNWLLNTEPFSAAYEGNTIQFKNTPGAYDVVAALDADWTALFGTVTTAASNFDIKTLLQGFVTFVGGPAGATADPSGLIKTTNQFFQAYYGLAKDSEFLPGTDLPFAQGPLNLLGRGLSGTGFPQSQYVVGTFTADDKLTAPKDDKQAVIVGGPNDDVIHGTASGDDLIDGGGGNNTIFAGGGNDIIFGGLGNNILYGTTIANSTARDVLAGGAGDAVKADQVANPDEQVSPPQPGSSTIYAGTGDNIIIGSGGTDTFNIDATQNINSIDVVWDNGGTDTLNVAGKAYIIEVSDPNATLQSVENVDEFKLAKQYAPQNGNFTGPLSTLGLDAPVVIVINPSKKDTLNLDPTLNGGSLDNVSPVKGGGVGQVPDNFESADILTAPPNEIFGVVIKDMGTFSTLTYNDAFNDFPGQITDPAGDVLNDVVVAQPHQTDGTNLIGFTNGDFGIQFENGGASSTDISTETIIGDGDHDFSALFPEDSDIDAQNGGEESPNFPPDISSTTADNSSPSPVLPAFFTNTTPTVDLQQFQQQKGGGSSGGGNGGGGPNETDQPIVLAAQISDTLVSITAATASGFLDTLIAGNTSADTLVSTGFQNTLVGNAAGSTLDGHAGFGTVAVYKPDNLTIDLGAGTAGVTGSAVSDTLIGVTTLAVLGTGDTLIGGPAASTLFSNAGGNTLEGGSPQTLAIYGLDNLTVDLATGTAQVNGASTSDSLVGITNVLVTGQDDTLIGGSGIDVLTSRGTDDTLIAGTGTDTLFSTGTGGMIISTATGNTVEGGFFQGPLAAYFIDDATVDLFTATATVNGSGVSDTLIGISTVGAFGTNDTLIGGSLASTLFSNAGGNTLEAGSGSTTAAYALDDVTVDLTAGTATANGSSASDTLIGINAGLVAGAQDTIVSSSGGHTLTAAGTGDTLLSSGTGDTLIANGTADVLMSSGSGNTLVAGSSPATLISTGAGDTLLGGVNGSTLDGSAGTQAVAAYDQSGVVVDLATDTAKASPTGPSDTLIGITAAALSGSGSTLIGGGGGDTLLSTGANETLLGGSGSNTLSSTGSDNTLIAGAVADVLISTGTNDTLIGNAQGSTLNGSKATGALAVYGINGVTVDLTTNSASLNGSSVSDTLVGISTLEASGSSETLIGGTGTTTLLSDSAGNTLIAGGGPTVAAYSLDNETVDLAAGTASLQGSGAVDRLLGIVDAAISGNEAVAVAGSGGDTLSASGFDDTLIGGGGADALAARGISDTLVAESGNSTLSSSGLNNTLIAGIGADTLASAGENDTLFGNAQGSTLTSTAVVTFPTDLLGGGTSQVQLTLTGSGAIAAYALDDVTVDLTAGTARLNGSSVADTLIGITTAAAFGINDTLIGGPGVTTLESNAAGNTVASGAGQAVAGYLLDNVSVDLAAGTAAVNGTAAADTLIGINSATVTGTNDTIVGGSGSGTLSANGSNDTLLAGSGTNTLIANGANETLFGNAAGSTLQLNSSASAVAVYNVDDVTIDLSAGKATVNGSNTFDSLQGISVVDALGSNDTLIGGFDSTLVSDAAGNTLEAGFSATTASYALDNLTVNFVAGTAGINGASLEDTLVGITVATLSGHNDTFVSNGGGNTLTGLGAGALAIYANDNVTVDLAAGTASVAGSSQSDALSGIVGVLLTGNNAVGKPGLASATLTASGSNDTLFGNVNGSTLEATPASSAAAIVYAMDDATVDLSAGIATSSMSAATDTLGGFNTATVSGSNDTLIGGAGAQVLSATGTSDVVIAGQGLDTLSASGTGNTLVGGSGTDVLSSVGTANTLVAGGGADTLISTGSGDVLFGNGAGSRLDGSGGTGAVAAYQLDNVTVDLATGTATVNGSGVSDTLVGIASAAVLGKNDTLIAATGSKMLLAGGSNDTIIGAGGTQTLETSGTGDTLLAGGGTDLLSSMGSGNTLMAGSGADTLMSSGLNDALIAGAGADILLSTGLDNTLIAGTAIDTLSSSGSGDTLVGNAVGSTLDGSAATDAIAAYSLNDVTVDLAVGTASVNGSNVSDTLIGITAAAALGSNDTLIGGTGASTLISNASGNTLEAGTGQTTASYAVDNVTVDLATGTATVNGSRVSDLLAGISLAVVSGTNDTLVGDGGADTLRATGSGDTLLAGTGPDVLSSNGQNNTLIGGNGADMLSSSGSADVLVGGSGAGVLSSSGSGNMLIAGSAADTLLSSGSGDALFGNAAGSTLDGSAGTRAIAAYSLNDVTVNLASGTARVNGSTVSDTLVGMTIVAGFGSNDTLIGGSGATTLLSDAAGNTLEAGNGPTTAGYGLDNVTVNLAAGSASVNGSSASDTLIGISSGLVSGSNDTLLGAAGDTLSSGGINNTLIAGSGVETLSSSGFDDTLLGAAGDTLSSGGTNNTLIAGSGVEALSSSGFDDTLVGNAAGSTLDGSAGTGATALYSLDNVTVDLAPGTARISGSSVADTLIGIHAATVAGANDTLIGDNSGDILSATGSNDTVFGGTGNDTLVINDGTDTFFGGGGNDTFVVLSATIAPGLNQPQNLIGDFNPSNPNETIDLSNMSGVSSFADLSFSTVTFGGQTYLEIALGNTGQAITLAGVTAGQLSAGNFVFAPVTATPPTLTVQNGSGTEDQSIALSISPTETDPHGSLSLGITGIPSDASLSNSQGALSFANGSISFTSAQLAAGALTGLAVVPTSADEPSFALHVTATSTDGTSTLSTNQDVNVTVSPYADAPSLTAQNARGTEGQPIALSISPALAESGAADPDASLSLTIAGIPASASLSNSQGALTFANGSITFTAAQLAGGALNGLAITPASDANFTLAVTATAQDGSSRATATANVQVTVAPLAPTLTISGTAQEGQTLTATAQTSDADVTIAYQWQSSSNGLSWTDISGATAATYSVVEANEGSQLRVTATATDSEGNATAATSAATAAVIDITPTLSVTVSGTAQEGQTLTATGVANDADAVVTYQWQNFNGTTWSNIAGATSATYTAAEADEGNALRVVATSTDSEGSGTTATSAATAAVVDITPALSVTVSGTAQEGQTLTATAVANDADAVVTYQWQSFNGTTWSNIARATASTYTAAEADEGNQLRVVTTSTDSDGSGTTATSAATAAVIDIAPTLSVTVSGSAQEGQTLTATAVANDADAVVTYQWQSFNGTTWSNIGGATNATYTSQEADEGNQLRVVATSADSDGSGTTATSAATAAVVDVTPTLAVSVNGNAVEGSTLTASPQVTSDGDGGTTTYQWQSQTGSTWSNISGATGSTYTAQEADEGHALRVSATFVDDTGQAVSATSNATAAVVDVAPTVTVSVSGNAVEGSILTATSQATSDGDGGTTTYQWQSLSGSTWSNISGATGSTYTAQETDQGHELRAVATFVDDTGQTVSASSNATAAVTDIAPTLSVTINGTAQEGQTLAAVAVANDADAVVTYQWQSLAGTTWSNISGATASTYVVTEANETHQLRVIATSADSDGGGASATSAATAAVTDIAPTLSATVSGTAQEGQTLTATAVANDGDAVVKYQWQSLSGSTWSNISGATASTYKVAEATEGQQLRVVATSTDGDGSGTTATSAATAAIIDVTPTLTVSISGTAAEGSTLTAAAHVTGDSDGGTTTYQWQSLIGGTWTNIAGATTTKYKATEADEGNELRAVATFVDDTGQSVSAASSPTAAVADIAPTLTVKVTGTAKEGQTLTATAAANDSDAVVTYQWQSLSGTTWSNISGATASTYVVAEADETHQLRVVATSSDSDGSGTTATSAATAAVTDIAPTLSVTISGIVQDGQTLTATAVANDSDAVVTYKWQSSLNGTTWSNISGATASTYTITEANEGHELRVVATSTDSDGSGTTANSAATAAVTDPPPVLTVSNQSITVAAGGSTALPITVAAFDSDDTVTVNITGLASYETVTDSHDSTVFSGNSITLTAAEVDSGLTLHSSYTGTGQPVNTLTVTASNTTNGEAVTSAAQTISVTDPPGAPSPFASLFETGRTGANDVLWPGPGGDSSGSSPLFANRAFAAFGIVPAQPGGNGSDASLGSLDQPTDSVLWRGVDPAGSAAGPTSAQANGSLYLSMPDAVGVAGVGAGPDPLMGTSAPTYQHPMLGIG